MLRPFSVKKSRRQLTATIDKPPQRRLPWLLSTGAGALALVFMQAGQAQVTDNDPFTTINANQAVLQGLTGQGISIGVVDYYLDTSLPLFNRANTIILGGQATLNGQTYELVTTSFEALNPIPPAESFASEIEAHGSTVVNVINGFANQTPFVPGGLAPSSQVVFASNVLFSSTADPVYVEEEPKGIVAAYNAIFSQQPNVKIINSSFGLGLFSTLSELESALESVDQELLNTIRRGVATDHLFVFANGNEVRAPNPNDLASLPHTYPDLEPNYITVTGVDADDNPAFYTPCGITMQWCITAPATVNAAESYFNLNDNGRLVQTIRSTSATSYGAPLVSAAAGLVQERFPYFTSAQIQQDILTTAKDLGEPGVDAVYGWGMLDVGKALNGPSQLLRDQTVTMDASRGGVNASDTWTNDITEGRRLIKAGTGQLTLAGNNHFDGITVDGGTLALAANNNFDQAATVNNGTLIVNGSLNAMALNVESGGTLAGGGTISAPSTVRGTFIPGNATGPLTVTNKLVIDSEATTRLVVNNGQYSRLVADGADASIALDGTVALEIDEASVQPGTSHEIVSTRNGGKITGEFTGIEQNSALTRVGMRYDLVFAPTDIDLVVNPVELPQEFNFKANTAAGAVVLNSLRDSDLALRAGAYSSWLNSVFTNGTSIEPVAREIGGQVYADGLSYLTRQPGLFDATLRSRSEAQFRVDDKTMWASAIAGNGRFGSREGVNSSSETSYGVALGVSKQWRSGLNINTGLGIIQGRVNTGDSSVRLNTLQLGVDAEYAFKSDLLAQPFVGGTLSVGFTDSKGTRRLPGFPLIRDQGNGGTFAASLRGGYNINHDQWKITPAASVSAVRARLNSHADLNDVVPLDVNGKRTTTSGALRVDAGYTTKVDQWTLQPTAGIGYTRIFSGANTVVNNSIEGYSVAQQSAARSKNIVNGSIGINATRANWQLAASIDAGTGSRANTQNYRLTVKHSF